MAAPQPSTAPTSFVSSSLYVGDLSAEVSEHHLFDLFSKVGHVVSVRINRDAHSRRSLGYAYVNFAKPEDADRALDTLNYTPILGVPCRLMWCHRDPSLRRSGVGNVFVSGLDPSVDNKMLHDTFSAFGNILSCKVAVDGEGKSRGHGFVHFETEEAAAKAIRDANNMPVAGKPITVVSFQARKKTAEDLNRLFTDVFVKNLEDSVDDAKLAELFAPFGKITKHCVARDPDGKSRCFGWVNYETPDQARAAVEGLNGKKMGTKEVYVGRAQKRAERQAALKAQYEQFQGSNVYVKNLDDSFEDKKLQQLFTPYGTITSAKVMRDEAGNSRGFGFVCFSTPEEAMKAIQNMNNQIIGQKKLFVALAQRKEDRVRSLESWFNYRQQGGPGAYGRVPRMDAAMPGPPQVFPAGMYFAPGQPAPYPGQPGPGVPRGGPYFLQPPMPFPVGAPYPPQVAVAAAAAAPPTGPGRAPRQPRPAGRGVPPPPAGGPGGPMVPGKAPMGAPAPAGRAGSRNFKYTPNVRNAEPAAVAVPVMAPVPVAPAVPAPVPAVPAPVVPAPAAPVAPVNPDAPISAQDIERLVKADPSEQRQLIGERLYPLIARTHGDQAGKITGMLLEMDSSELLALLESREELDVKVKEAYEVLVAAQKEEEATAAAHPAPVAAPPS